jgi:threonine dehydrogenase-like Zn-dependent dehydrogenase
VVLRKGRLEVRETADPVAGPGELLLRTLSTAICASDVVPEALDLVRKSQGPPRIVVHPNG